MDIPPGTLMFALACSIVPLVIDPAAQYTALEITSGFILSTTFSYDIERHQPYCLRAEPRWNTHDPVN
jgi:hypothetical protein